MSEYIAIEEAKYLQDYKIYLRFSDGKENIVDFKDFLFSSKHPDIQKYQDIANFKSFNIAYGDLEWNDYDLAFPIYDLYQNKIA